MARSFPLARTLAVRRGDCGTNQSVSILGPHPVRAAVWARAAHCGRRHGVAMTARRALKALGAGVMDSEPGSSDLGGTRERIMDVALREFADKGLSGARVDDIAALV